MGSAKELVLLGLVSGLVWKLVKKVVKGLVKSNLRGEKTGGRGVEGKYGFGGAD